MPDQNASKIIRLFTEFLEAFGKSTAEERRAFLDFIGAQSRADLLALAEAIANRDKPGR
jgi:hypothetical protein